MLSLIGAQLLHWTRAYEHTVKHMGERGIFPLSHTTKKYHSYVLAVHVPHLFVVHPLSSLTMKVCGII